MLKSLIKSNTTKEMQAFPISNGMKKIKKFIIPFFASLVIFTILILLVFVLPTISTAQCIGTADKPCPKDEQSIGGTRDEQPIGGTKTSSGDGKIHNPLGTNGPTDIPAFIKNVLEGALKIAIPVVALAIIYSGFLFVFAMGNSEKLKKAKDALLYSLIGAAILLGSWAIANLIVTTINNIG